MSESIFPRKSFSPIEIDRILRTAAPIPTAPFERVDIVTGNPVMISRAAEIEARLGSLSAVIIYSDERATAQHAPSGLAKRFHAIAAAAETLLEAIGPLTIPPTQIETVLMRIAERELSARYKPRIWKTGTITANDYGADIQFRSYVDGVRELGGWAGRAEAAAQERTAGAGSEGDPFGIDRWDFDPISEALDVIFRIWEHVLQRELNAGAVTKDEGVAYGQLLEFSLACLAAVGITEGRGTPLSQDSIRARIRRRLPIYRKEQAYIKQRLATYERDPKKT
jgi:hypothetical protein